MNDLSVPFDQIETPARLLGLVRTERGYPVPYFVQWIDAVPDFRVVDPHKMANCVKGDLCWICGKPMTAMRLRAFVGGPSCVINRISAEPPSHNDCAAYAAQACPFLAHPKMVRPDDNDLLAAGTAVTNPAAEIVERNPGVCAVWTPERYTIHPHGASLLWRLEAMGNIEWYAHGRLATRCEVQDALETALAALVLACERQATSAHVAIAKRRLHVSYDVAVALLPTRTDAARPLSTALTTRQRA